MLVVIVNAPKDSWETGIYHMRRPPGELSPGVTGHSIIASSVRLRLGGQWYKLTAHVSTKTATESHDRQ